MNPTDPLSQLRDIHYPEPVSWWPPAPGWWLLAVFILLAISYAIYRFNLYRQANRYRHNAEQAIMDAHQQYIQNNKVVNFAQALNRILKRTALAHYPEREFAGLSGQQWLVFLDKGLDDKAFSEGAGRILATAPYQQNSQVDVEALTSLCKKWVRKHQ
jgi:hypothetical protein